MIPGAVFWRNASVELTPSRWMSEEKLPKFTNGVSFLPLLLPCY